MEGRTSLRSRLPADRRRHVALAAALWALLTATGLLIATRVDLHPVEASREAEIIDSAFNFLLLLAVPVFTFVFVVLVYSIVRFRADGADLDGLGYRHNRKFVGTWVAITSALAVLVIIHPGLTGLAELESEPQADLTVEVLARQWAWTYTYVESGLTIEAADELVLPVGERVRFLVTSEDVIHSFWIPGFRTKTDAVPGTTTEILATPTVIGTFREDPNFRVQCAELCGTGHARMRTRIRVVTGDEFEEWLAENGGAG